MKIVKYNIKIGMAKDCITIYSFLGIQILVTAGTETKLSSEVETTSELITIEKHHGKVISTYSRLATGFPTVDPNVAKWFSATSTLGGLLKKGVFNAFGGILDGVMIIGHSRKLFTYDDERNMWFEAQNEEHVLHDRSSAQGCALNDIYLVCGGELGTGVELLQFEAKRNTLRQILKLPSNIELAEFSHLRGIHGTSAQKLRNRRYVQHHCESAVLMATR